MVNVKCHLCIEDLLCIFQCLINIISAQFIMRQRIKSGVFMILFFMTGNGAKEFLIDMENKLMLGFSIKSLIK